MLAKLSIYFAFFTDDEILGVESKCRYNAHINKSKSQLLNPSFSPISQHWNWDCSDCYAGFLDLQRVEFLNAHFMYLATPSLLPVVTLIQTIPSNVLNIPCRRCTGTLKSFGHFSKHSLLLRLPANRCLRNLTINRALHFPLFTNAYHHNNYIYYARLRGFNFSKGCLAPLPTRTSLHPLNNVNSS